MRYKQFRHLDVPETWRQYWSKYPEGYTILEALINWVSQVDDMADNVNNWNEYLKDFVENIDKRLQPIAEEILREMAEDGTLEQIINQTIFGELNEKVDTATEKLNSSNYVDGVSYTKQHDGISSTWYYLTRIPHKDKDGEILKLKHHNMQYATKTIKDFAIEKGATFASNAAWTVENQQFSGVTMVDGVPQDYVPLTSEQLEYRYILGITEDNTLRSFIGDTSVAQLSGLGIKQAITAFIPLIEDGNAVSQSLLTVFHMDEKHPRQAIAQLPNKDILYLSCGGRGFDGQGMTASDVVRILLGQGATFAHMLDGGGSVSTVVRGVHINHPIDSRGMSPRKHAHALYIDKDNKKTIQRDTDFIQVAELINQVDTKVNRKSEKYNIFDTTTRDLLNGWTTEIVMRMTDQGIVHMFGSIVAGTVGSTQSIIANIADSRFFPITNVAVLVTDPNTPWTTLPALVVNSSGVIKLVGEANDWITTGQRIHFNAVYKVNSY